MEVRGLDIASFKDVVGMVNDLPPMPSRIMASHAVPFGKVYRQWMTDGRLILWANRGEIADIRRIDSRVDPARPYVGYLGIPVFNA